LTWLGATTATSAADSYTYQVPCTTTITGTNVKQLTVASGLTCLVNATQNGQVTVEAGAALSVTNSTVNGTVTATSPSASPTASHRERRADRHRSHRPGRPWRHLADGTACAADTIPGASPSPEPPPR